MTTAPPGRGSSWHGLGHSERMVRLDDAEADAAGEPRNEAVDREWGEGVRAEVADELAHGEVGGDGGDDEADAA
jgi:hypothetical protein